MKYIQLKIEDSLHKEIKLKAVQAGKTMPEYVLDCIQHPIRELRGECPKCKDTVVYERKELKAPAGYSHSAKTKKILGITKEQQVGKKPKGFTITEFIIWTVILTILAGILATSYYRRAESDPEPECFIQEKGWSDDYRQQAFQRTIIDCEDFSPLTFAK